MQLGALGWLRDPPDARDYPASEILASAPVPARSDLRPYVTSILDQGGLSSCVANAIMQAVRLVHVRDLRQRGDDTTVPALGCRLSLYHQARLSHGFETMDAGTYIRAAMGALARLGFCPEDVWPYVEANVNKHPPFRVLSRGFDQTGHGVEYRRIFETGSARVDAVKRALGQGFPVVLGSLVSEAFVRNQIDPTVPLPPPVGEKIAGGHAWLLDGHEGDSMIGCNSYGDGFGDLGHFRMSADWLAWAMTADVWILARVPAYSET